MENMTPLELEKFSSQLRPIIDIVERKQLEQEDKRKRGELFNVFDQYIFSIRTRLSYYFSLDNFTTVF